MKLIKSYFKSKLTEYLLSVNENYMSTHMVWGYQNIGGEFSRHTRLSNTVFINHPERTRIGEGVYVGHFTILDGTGDLVIEDGCQIGCWVGIFSHSSHIAIRLYGKHYTEIPEGEKKGFIKKPITIGRCSSIGNGVRLFPGGTVGKGAFIATNAVINEPVPDFAMVDSNGKIIGDTRSLDEEYLNDPQIKAWYDEWMNAFSEKR